MSIWGTFMSIGTGGLSTIYKYLAIAGVVLGLCVSAFFYGKHLGDLQSKVAIANYKDLRDRQDADLLGMNTITSNRIVEEVVTKIKVIHDVQTQTNTIIQNNITDHGLLSLGWVYIYDAATTGAVPDATLAANGTPSTITASDALQGVNDNFAVCRANAEELTGLQQWITDTNKNIDASNKKLTHK